MNPEDLRLPSGTSQRYLIKCACGEEIALLIGSVRDFADQDKVLRGALGGRQVDWPPPSGQPICRKCRQVVVVTRRDGPA